MATASTPAWTKEHEDALSGMVGLGIPKKEARQFLEALASQSSGELIRKALAMRTHSQRPPPSVPSGGPGNAVPLHHPSPAPARPAATPPVPAQTPAAPPPPAPLPRPVAPRPAPPSTPPPPAPGPGEWAAAQMAGGMRRPSRPPVEGTPLIRGQWSPSSMVPAGQERPPIAPIGPAAAQLQPTAPAPPAEKPRVRVRAVGSRIPPAPLGGPTPEAETAAPTKAPEAPAAPQQSEGKLPRIRNEEELAKVLPGTEFVWIPDGHIYRKNE